MTPTLMKESDHLVTLAQEFLGTLTKFCWPAVCCDVDWLLANEFAECTEARRWESSAFNVCANNNLLAASD